MKQRLEYINVLRAFACFLVVLTHSAMPSPDGSGGFWMYSYSFLTSPSSELFLTLSGAVLLPCKVGMKEFYKKRFMKLIPPVFFWSVAINLIYILEKKLTVSEGVFKLSLMVFKPAIGIYWFIYVIIGLYLLAPIISKWLVEASKKEIEFFLLLWLINMALPYFNLLVPNFYDQIGSHYWTLNYFGGFLGYWLIGYYLCKYPIRIGWKDYRFFISCIGMILYVLTIFFLKLNNINDAQFVDNLQIGSVFAVILIFTIVQSLPQPQNITRIIIDQIAQYSFGIYLIHILIAREFVWRLFEYNRIHPILETPLIAIISIFISYIVLRLISKLSYSKYIIGV